MNPITDSVKPYLYLACAVALVCTHAAVGVWQNTVGHVSERDAWQKRENKELREANSTIIELNNKVRATEHEHNLRLADVSDNYQKELRNAKDQRDRDVAAARNGTLRLRFNAPGVRADRGSASGTAASAGRCDGAATSDVPAAATADIPTVALPNEITAKLYELVDDADEVVKQLQACQGVVRSDRGLK